MKKSFALSFIAIVPMMGAANAADGMPELEGHWKSLACELRPQQGQKGVEAWYLQRDIVVKGNTIDARFKNFADPSCTVPLYDLHFVGTVKVNGDSKVAPGAKSADIVVDKLVELTPKVEGFAGFLNSAGKGSCGADLFKVGSTQNVRETGCKPIGLPPNAVTTEFETLVVHNDGLFFGARPLDGSMLLKPENRPTALQVPLFKVE